MKKGSALSGILGAAKGKFDDNEEIEVKKETRQPSAKRDIAKNIENKGSEAVSTENGKPVDTNTSKPVNTAKNFKRGDEKLVHITIEVPQSLRHHWKIESARKNRSFRDVAVDAFTKEFGLPEQGEN